MTKKLTVKAIETMKAGDVRRELPDGEVGGLYLVLQPSGAKSFALRYRHASRPRKLTLGPFDLGLGKARELAREALVELARGNDPGVAKQKRKAAQKAAAKPAPDLVEAVTRDFVAHHVKRNLKASTQYEVERLLTKELAPWHGRRIGDIEPQDVHRLLDRVVARGAEITANRLHAALRRMFRWAKERRIIQASPMDDIPPPISEKGRARERVLDDRELALVWKAAGALDYPFAPMIRLLILTGQRRNEVAAMRWSELDIDKALWTIPGERSKNHREHTIPLPPAALAILQEIPQNRPWRRLCVHRHRRYRGVRIQPRQEPSRQSRARTATQYRSESRTFGGLGHP